MKRSAAGGLVGGLLGAVVAVLAHYLSHTLPSTYYVGLNDSLVSNGPRLIHPSWWPSLPIAIVAGVLIGLLVGYVADRLGVRLVRTRQQAPTRSGVSPLAR